MRRFQCDDCLARDTDAVRQVLLCHFARPKRSWRMRFRITTLPMR
jgi:hypothetical protein